MSRTFWNVSFSMARQVDGDIFVPLISGALPAMWLWVGQQTKFTCCHLKRARLKGWHAPLFSELPRSQGRGGNLPLTRPSLWLSRSHSQTTCPSPNTAARRRASSPTSHSPHPWSSSSSSSLAPATCRWPSSSRTLCSDALGCLVPRGDPKRSSQPRFRHRGWWSLQAGGWLGPVVPMDLKSQEKDTRAQDVTTKASSLYM